MTSLRAIPSAHRILVHILLLTQLILVNALARQVSTEHQHHESDSLLNPDVKGDGEQSNQQINIVNDQQINIVHDDTQENHIDLQNRNETLGRQQTDTIEEAKISYENETMDNLEERVEQLQLLLHQERLQAALDWAPVIWIHPNETFFPGDVHDFLNSSETSGTSWQEEERTGRVYKILPEGPSSEALHLSASIDTDCKNCRLPDILHGNLPSEGLIGAPIYTHIEECSPNLNNLEYQQIDVDSTLSIDEQRMQVISSQYEEEEFLANDYNFIDQGIFRTDGHNKNRQIGKIKQNFTVTYWSFYPYNRGKEVCTGYVWLLGRVAKPLFRGRCLGENVQMGNHVGDWEHISIHFEDGSAKHLYISSHNFGVYYTLNSTTGHFDYVKKEVRKGLPVSVRYPQQIKRENGRIVLYSALGSHGLWPHQGTHFFNRILVPLKDETARGYLWNTWEHLDVINQPAANEETSRQWLNYRGRWGNPKNRCHPALFGFCETNGGPKGIKMKKKNFQCDGSTS